MGEGEDLYDDLYEDVGDMPIPKAPFQSFHEDDTREEEFKKKEAELKDKVELLQKEVEALQQDKAVLTRNISCLFKTAQMELARKDKQMKELRDENLRLKLGGTRGPANVRPHVNKAAPLDKSSGQGIVTRDNNHHNSSTVAIPDAQSSDEPPDSQDRQLHYQSQTALSTDRVTQGSSSIQLSFRGQISQCHVMSPKTTSEVTVVDSAHDQAVEMDGSGQSIRGPVLLESERVAVRIHEHDSDRHRQSLAEGKKARSPSAGLLRCSQQRDSNSGGTRRTAAASHSNQRSSSNDKDSRSDRPRDGRFDDNMRHADCGHTTHRSPERNRDRDRRANGNLRDLDNRKRQRSVSRDRDVRPEHGESSRAAKAIHRSDSESSRDRQKDRSHRSYRCLSQRSIASLTHINDVKHATVKSFCMEKDSWKRSIRIATAYSIDKLCNSTLGILITLLLEDKF